MARRNLERLNLEVGIFLSSSEFANPVTVNNVGSVSGRPTDIDVFLTPGDVIAFGLTVENNDVEDTSAIFATFVTDSALLRLRSGAFYSGILARFCWSDSVYSALGLCAVDDARRPSRIPILSPGLYHPETS